MSEITRELLRSRVGEWEVYSSRAWDEISLYVERIHAAKPTSVLDLFRPETQPVRVPYVTATPRTDWSEETRRVTSEALALSSHGHPAPEPTHPFENRHIPPGSGRPRVPYWPAASLNGPANPLDRAGKRSTVYLIDARSRLTLYWCAAISLLGLFAILGWTFSN